MDGYGNPKGRILPFLENAPLSIRGTDTSGPSRDGVRNGEGDFLSKKMKRVSQLEKFFLAQEDAMPVLLSELFV